MFKRDYAILIGCFVLAILLTLGIFRQEAMETASWGLCFSEGESPTGPVSADQLRQYDAAYLDPRGEKVLYLTFDAGYENGSTAKILDTLQKHGAPAAFFLAGNYLQKNGDLVRRMAAEGHIVGNHTMHHPDMTKKKDPESFGRELQDLEALYTQVTGAPMPKFYRPPQGIFSRENLEMAQAMGYKTVFWSLAYADWDNRNQPAPAEALRKLQGRTHNGAVVLLHSTSETNAQILDELLTWWKAQGYRFGTLEELFG